MKDNVKNILFLILLPLVSMSFILFWQIINQKQLKKSVITTTQYRLLDVARSEANILGYLIKHHFENKEIKKFVAFAPVKVNGDIGSIAVSIGYDEILHSIMVNAREDILGVIIVFIFSCFISYIIYIKQNKTTQELRDEIEHCKRTENELQELTQELTETNAELEEFAYIASHDLQEPLRTVSAYCQLLKANYYEQMSKEDQKYLDYAVDSIGRMKILVKELLDYSRIGKKDRPFEEVNILEIIEEVQEDFKLYIKETNAIIIVKDEMPLILGIRFRIKQLMHNLISNSLKFRGIKHPVIKIGCKEREEGDGWTFYIEDNGIGIEQQYYDKIFGIFKRLYSRDDYPGTGIGLALCKRIVETHSGAIWVDPEIKEGTKICFTIIKSVIMLT